MIQIKNLNYSIGNKLILENINLTLNDSEFAAIIGPNGAGKSTLIKIIIGIINQYKGNIFIDGMEHKEWLKNNIIGYVPQKEEFDRQFPARAIDIVLLGLVHKIGLFKRFHKRHIEKAYTMLEKMGISNKANELIGNLSGGEFQRVLIARALIAEAKYLFLDEPESGVDKESINSFYNLLINLNKEGKTILLVSHDIGMMTNYSRYIICLNKTLHCHTQSELLDATMIKKTYGDVMKLIDKEY